MPASVAALRALLDQRFPEAAPLARRSDALATGIPPLDRTLPAGGFPRGKLTTWTLHGGSTAILRATAQATLAAGERAAWVDGALTIPGTSWQEGPLPHLLPLLLRPRSRTHALRATEELLRCGGFALVVLSGVESEGAETVRLTRLARDGGSVLVEQTTRSALAALRITSRILPESYRWHRTPFGDPAQARGAVVQVRVRSLGWNARAEIPLPVRDHELPLGLAPGLIDRRGVLRGIRSPSHGTRHA